MVPRGLLACFALGVALVLLPDGCCDCDTAMCDADTIALDLPAGAAYSLRIVACAESSHPIDVGLRFVDEAESDSPDLTMSSENPRFAVSSDGHGWIPHDRSLCDDGLVVTFTNTRTARLVGVVSVYIGAGDDWKSCDLTLEQP